VTVLKSIIRSIDEMPHLKARLGKARVDRIRYAHQADASKLPRSTNVPNTVMDDVQGLVPHRPGCPIADILSGAAHLDPNQRVPLSVDRLYNMLQCMPMINTREVKKMMDVDDRQAQRYVRAMKFALPHISSLV